MFRAHRAQRPKPQRTPFPSREWLLAAKRLLEMQMTIGEGARSMTSKLGCHWQRQHPDRRDMPHVEAMQYKSVKLFKNEWDNRDFCRDLLAVLPHDSYILARDHALSEQKEDMWRDAQAAGIDHANQWINKVKSGQYHLPLDRTFFLGINEPDATSGDRNKIDIYTASFLERLQQHGLRGGAFNFSTGHPRTVDGTPHSPADYSVFERSHQAIVRGNHIAVLHIYGTGAVPCAPGHYDRLKACTWQDVEWVVGECGADEHVIGGGNHDGYLISMNGHINDYCSWLDRLIMGVDDPRIHSFQVFTYDFSHPWDSFNVREIRDALESYTWQHMSVAPTKPTPPPPAPATLYVTAKSGLNLRAEPVTGKVLVALPYGARAEITGMISGTWWPVRYEGVQGWIHSGFTSDVPPAPTPAPEQPGTGPVASGIIDPLVLEAIVLTESAGSGFEDGRLKIRLEAHLLLGNTWGNPDKFQGYFRHESDYLTAYFRRNANEQWIMYHGNQELEWEAFEFACTLDKAAALRCTSFGVGQIMGFNAKRVGYATPQHMFDAFRRDELPQVMAMVNYCLTDNELVAAIRNKDWGGIIRGYNGVGLEAVYAPRLLNNYRKLGGVA